MEASVKVVGSRLADDVDHRSFGATDIGDRPPEVDPLTPTARDHSVLDELGIGAVMPGTPRTASVTTSPSVTYRSDSDHQDGCDAG